jgi:hypothetical protein
MGRYVAGLDIGAWAALMLMTPQEYGGVADFAGIRAAPASGDR